MASQERLSVDAAARRLGITPDAVRSRIKRGTLWAVRRKGRVQVVLRDTLAREEVAREVATARFAGHAAPTTGPTHETARDTVGTDPAKDEAAVRLRAEIAHQKHRVRELADARFAGPGALTTGPTHGPTHGAAPGADETDLATDEAATRLREEFARQKHRVRVLERDLDRLDRVLARQTRFLNLEHALRARLQDQLDRLNERLSDVLPEILDDPTERADRLWKRLGRQVERLGMGPDQRDD